MIHIAFNIDKNYIEHCKVVMKSILANTKSMVHFHIIGLDHFDHMSDMVTCYGVPDISIIKSKTNFGHITTSACYRLFMPELLPLDKVIYLDCDIIVLDDVKKLWEYDTELIAGVIDPLFIHHAQKNYLHHCYINSGVLLVNLKRMRKINYIERLKKVQNGFYNLSLLDQDMINIAFENEIEHLPEKWNVYSQIYRQTTSDMIKARENPSIIHWCGGEKPWNNKTVWNYEKYARFDN